MQEVKQKVLKNQEEIKTLQPGGIELKIHLCDKGGWIEARQNDRQIGLESRTWKNSEKRMTPTEKELVIPYRYWPKYRALVTQGGHLMFKTDHGVKGLVRGSIAGGRALQSRWDKWIVMLEDPVVEINRTGKLEKKVKIPEKEEECKYRPFTDGSKTIKDEKGHWARILYQKGNRISAGKGSEGVSAQDAEVVAVVKGLAECIRGRLREVDLITDSYYVAQGLKEDLAYWEATEFQTAKGDPLAM